MKIVIFNLCFGIFLLTHLETSWGQTSLIDELVENEQSYVSKEEEYLRCLVGQESNSKELREIFKNAKTDIAKLVKNTVSEILNDVSCDAQTLIELKSQLETIALISKELKESLDIKTKVYSDKPISKNIGTRQIEDEEFFSNESKQFKACPNKELSRLELNNQKLLHGLYLQYGHNCVAKMYKSSSLKIGKSSFYQSAFDKELSKSLDDYNKNSLKGLRIVIIPSFVYEKRYAFRVPIIGKMVHGQQVDNKPSQKEKITMNQLCKRLKRFGVKSCKVIHRVTTQSLEKQAKDTWEGLEKEIKRDRPFIILAQSAGSQVLNYILENYSDADLLSLKDGGLKGIFNVGGTPRGSSIPRFKMAPDHFIGDELKRIFKDANGASRFARFGAGLLAFFAPNTSPKAMKRFWELLRNSLNLDNIEKLASTNPDTLFNPNVLDDLSFNSSVPIYNLISLVDDLRDLTPSTDPVLLHQLMYGPSEGSSPLADTSIEGLDSHRIFYNRDHLAFFNAMTDDELLLFNLQMLYSAKESGFLDFL